MKRRSSLGRYLPFTLAFYGVMGGVGLVVILYRAPDVSRRLLGPEPGREFLLGLLTAIAILLLSQLLRAHSSEIRRFEAVLAKYLGDVDSRAAWLLALSSGIGEELLFRGALQPEIGLVAATLIFGLMHFPIERDLWPWPLYATLVGLILAALFERSGSLIAPTTAHIFINAVQLILIGRRTPELTIIPATGRQSNDRAASR